MSVVAGLVERGFEPVAEAFAANFDERGDIGAACCVYRDGKAVVDVWGGHADREAGFAWAADSLTLVFSTTKGVTAAVVHLLAERGVIDLDAPVAEYWPEFAAAGKGRVPVRWVLSHQAGLPAVEGTFTLAEVFEATRIVDALAAQTPAWEPGTAHGYHARSYGWLLGEIVRRVTGRTIGQVLATEVAAPLELDLFVGLPARERPRVARIYPPEEPDDPKVRELLDAFLGPDTLLGQTLRGPSNLFAYDDMWNDPDLQAAEMPSSNGIATARALARLYASLIGEVDGVRLLRPETVAAASAPQVDGPDQVIGMPTRFGLGFALPPMIGTRPGPRAFGHPGAGGSLAFADPDAGIAVGYVMNRMKLGLTGDERSVALVDAVYDALPT